MGYAIIVFLILFLLIGSGLLLLFYREAMGRRITALLATGGREQVSDNSRFSQAGESFGSFAGSLERFMPRSKQETSVVQKRLILAGYRQDHHVSVFYGSKVIVPVLVVATIWLSGAYHWSPIILFLLSAMLGYLAPDYWLSYKIKSREQALRMGLPDTLDLLVVCLEAGLSLDQALLRATDELQVTHPVIADELGLVMLEIRAGKPRIDAWKALTERTDDTMIRMFVSILIQADQFGTGVSKTLRIHSDTIRIQRRQRIEELAAKTPVKLVFPLAFLIFPSVYVVAVGSAFIQIAQLFSEIK